MMTKDRWMDLGYLMVGSLFLALAINLVLSPNQLVAGGANGLAIILEKKFHSSLALTLYAINIPLLILSFVALGKEVGMKTILGSLIYPFFVGLTSFLPPLTSDPILSSIFGGVLAGLGLGLVFRGNASTGGTATIAQVINKFAKIPLGIAVFLIDGIIILSAGFVFNFDKVLFALICLFVISRVIDLVQVGGKPSKNILIISDKMTEVEAALLSKMEVGVTRIPITGGFDKNEKEMLMCVIPENKYHAVSECVLEIDSTSFLTVMPAQEVLGRGFSLAR
ncbi:YitT family protein [Vagococcus coleopterorum]|uniref:YitT family protein n=2 Tax=Vagococcus coleopterorum TaxID=2714946 RepID=A0A6G8APR6_9ENTE|nr:YitT family protein [Vagococcus coleopterorum]QIL46970.1 YitT family protein [Vagococcus coleopterorum]